MSGAVPASSDDCKRVLNSVEEPKGSWRILTWMFGYAFSKRATPLVRNDFDAGIPCEPAASGSFQIVRFVTFELAPATADTSEAPVTIAMARPIFTELLRRSVLRPSP
jgi:hypothetical protein